MSTLENIVVNEEVVAKEGEFVLHVGKEPADQSGEMDHVRRLVFVEDGLSLLKRSITGHGLALECGRCSFVFSPEVSVFAA